MLQKPLAPNLLYTTQRKTNAHAPQIKSTTKQIIHANAHLNSLILTTRHAPAASKTNTSISKQKNAPHANLDLCITFRQNNVRKKSTKQSLKSVLRINRSRQKMVVWNVSFHDISTIKPKSVLFALRDSTLVQPSSNVWLCNARGILSSTAPNKNVHVHWPNPIWSKAQYVMNVLQDNSTMKQQNNAKNVKMESLILKL